MYISTIDKQTNFRRAWNFIDNHQELENLDDLNVWTLAKAFDYIDRRYKQLEKNLITETEFNFIVAEYLIKKFDDNAFTVYTSII